MKRVILPAIVFFAVVSLAARTWPDDSERIKTMFGQPESGHFSRGLEFHAEGQRVTAWNDGEVIWNNVPVPGITLPGKPSLVIEHNGGFRSSSQNLESRPDLEHHITQGDWTGYADDGSWLFQLTDTIRSRIVNPAFLLPVWDNSNIPSRTVFLVKGRDFLEIKNQMVLEPGNWSLVLEGIIPVELSLSWVGQSIISMRLDSLVEQDGVLVLETPSVVTYDDVYDEEGRVVLRDILLSTGVGIMELRMSDRENQVDSQYWNLIIQAE